MKTLTNYLKLAFLMPGLFVLYMWLCLCVGQKDGWDFLDALAKYEPNIGFALTAFATVALTAYLWMVVHLVVRLVG